MKNLFILSLLSPFFIWGQQLPVDIKRNAAEPARSSVHVHSGESIEAVNFFQQYESLLGLSQDHSMKQTSTQVEKNGIQHYKFKQYYKGLEVYGADYILHEKNKNLLNGNGLIFPIVDLSIEPRINKDVIKEISAQSLNLNLDQIDFHSQELVVLNSHYPFSDGEMILAYILEVHIDVPTTDHRKIIIHANTGEVIRNFTIQTNCFQDKGKVQTRYHGEHDIDAEKEGSVFISKDLTRGGGITVTNKAGKLYQDSDNQWVKGTNNYNNGMHDLFWGLQKTYDYYKQRLNRDGADNKKLPIKAFLLDTEVYVNAFWSPTLWTLNFGIGDNGNFSALTSIDVVGHEFTHGVTQFSAGLEYLYEAGAMNEAFSDIIGKAIEYEYDRDSFNWYVGGRFSKSRAQAFRNMENPNAYQCPKYYKGIQWKTGSGDNGGVHYNSGVLNYWYYLLCTGKDTVNEAKVRFKVAKLGFDSATLFAYTLLNNYLGKTSGYYDAREASLLLAKNWWGECSPGYHNIAEAWKAVGVGSNATDNDLQLINTNALTSACKDGGYFISSRINNQSCSKEIPIGTELKLYYKLDTFSVVTEIVTLSQAIPPSSHMDFFFTKNPTIVKNGQSRLTVWMEANVDADTSNNRYSFLVSKISTSTDHDFRINNFNIIGAPCPIEGDMYIANSSSAYNGCTVIPPGNELQLLFEFKDSTYRYKYLNPTSIYPQGFINIMNIPIPRSFLGLKKFKLSLIWPKDTVLNNNSLNTQIVMVNERVLNELETFSDAKYDSVKLVVFSDSFNSSGILQNTEFGSEVLTITGGNIISPTNTFIPRNDADQSQVFSRNARFTTKMYICADVSQITSPKLEFDLAQKIGSFNYDSINLAIPLAPASTRIRFFNSNNDQLDQVFIFNASKTFVKEHHEYDIPPTTTYIDVTNLCFNGKLDSNGEMSQEGDFVVFDNVIITGGTLVSDPEKELGIRIFPNPSQDKIFINCQSDLDCITEYKIINSLGQIVEFKSKLQPSKLVELSVQEPGTYHVSVKSKEGRVMYSKFIVIR